MFRDWLPDDGMGSSGVNGVEPMSTVFKGRAVTCRSAVSAGHGWVVDRVDTEVLAQQRPTALNGVEPQVNGIIEGDKVPVPLPAHFGVPEVRATRHDQVG
ncbi:hypothetical protein GCM10009682_23790 [Luedemannella flava]|uniref:Uncharacterized protein n=2 Tax=Luedemannella flava TaxID=349316 RepID=A0ABN2LWB1_9ACTN